MFRSVYTRLLVLFLAILLTAMGFLSVVTYDNVRQNKIDARLGELSVQARDLAYLASQRGVFGSKQTDRYMQWKCRQIDEEFGAYILILDRLGNLIIGSDREEEGFSVEMALEFLGRVVDQGQEIRIRAEGENPAFTICVPWLEGNRVVGAVFIHTSAQEIRGSYAGILLTLVRTTLIALALGAALILLLSRYITLPLQKMANAVERFARGDFSERVGLQKKRRDEIGLLAESFDSMADELEHTEKIRRTLIANVSHELRSPLTSIQGFVTAIRDGTIEPEKQGQYLDIVLDETRRLSKLITSMLDLSAMDDGKVQLRYTDFDINEMILRVLAATEPELRGSGIDVDIRFSEEVCMVSADADRMEQVLFNLVGNAAKYAAGENGKLTVYTQAHEKTAVVRVQDNGPGISPEDLPYIFDRFYRVDKSRTGNGKSTGLGLAIAKSILEQHGHSITATSSQGEGTCFEFTVDIAQGKSLPAQNG